MYIAVSLIIKKASLPNLCYLMILLCFCDYLTLCKYFALLPYHQVHYHNGLNTGSIFKRASSEAQPQ